MDQTRSARNNDSVNQSGFSQDLAGNKKNLRGLFNGAKEFNNVDLICLSHLRWDFVFQRPQHLLTRCAKERRVFFFEEPIFSADQVTRLDISQREKGVWVVVPHLPEGMGEAEILAAQRELVNDLIDEFNLKSYILWYYTPMALGFTDHLCSVATVYDCMDELSLFKNAPQALKDREKELFRRADLVFTGGQSLYESKKDRHHSVHAFPSSIDYHHFAQARKNVEEPKDQASIPFPRIGFFGVLDERLDIELLRGAAEARPDWQFVMIGPIVKIDPAHLPHLPNIHYLGSKSYKELPQYLAGWNVAMLPFAKNDSTRFISPTKTPEYLAAGKPVVSTSIRDVVRPYGEKQLVSIADTVDEFIRAAASVGMDEEPNVEEWLNQVDAYLAQTSWDKTWNQMSSLILSVVEGRLALEQAAEELSKPTSSVPHTPIISQSPAQSSYNQYQA